MKYIVLIDIGEPDPLVLGPFNHELDAQVYGQDLHNRWGNLFEVQPVFTTYGEYIAFKEGRDT